MGYRAKRGKMKERTEGWDIGTLAGKTDNCILKTKPTGGGVDTASPCKTSGKRSGKDFIEEKHNGGEKRKKKGKGGKNLLTDGKWKMHMS